MLILAWANLTHRKVRSVLSILAVAIAIALLLILVGLSSGTLNEISWRIESVDAEIIVRDRHFDLGSMSGGSLWQREAGRILAIELDGQAAVAQVMPVFLGRVKLAGLTQNVFGVCPEDFAYFAGSRQMLAGEVFEDMAGPETAVSFFIEQSRRLEEAPDHPVRPLPLIIDDRLRRAGDLAVGDRVSYGDTPAEIVGVIETGVAGRVFAPINMLRGANGIAAPTAHMFFVKARPGLSTAQLQQLVEAIEVETHRAASLVANYGQILARNFRNLTIFMSLVSIIALVICFLFILVTMYTIVLERGREIAILQSLGAGRWTVLRQTIQEAGLLCSLGTVLGVGLSFGARWLIQTVQPLMTVEMRPFWIGIALVVGVGGGIVSAVYPGYLALRNDPVETLSFE